MKTPPTWLIERVDFWRREIGVYDAWRFTTGVRRELQTPGTMATADPEPNLNAVELLFRTDRVRPGRDLDVDIVHELLHVVDVRRFAFVRRRLIPTLGEQAGKIALECYRDLVESEIEQITQVLVDAYARRPKPGDRPAKSSRRRRRRTK